MTESKGFTRRRFVQRGAVVAGAVLWTAPVVDVLSTQRAFAAAGSGQPAPISPPTTVVTPPSTVVLGETETKTPPPVDPADPVTRGRAKSTDPTGALPFTGAGLPVVGALETAGGLIAMGAVLHQLGTRRPGGSETDGT